MTDHAAFRRKLEGTWQCISMTLTSTEESNDIIHPWTENVTGSLMYSSDGYMSALICRPDLPHFTPNEFNAAPEQYQAVGAGINAYTGRYTLGERLGDRQIIYHHVEISTPPNWVGTMQTRYCTMTELEGGSLQIVMRPGQTMPAAGQTVARRPEVKFVKKPVNVPNRES